MRLWVWGGLRVENPSILIPLNTEKLGFWSSNDSHAVSNKVSRRENQGMQVNLRSWRKGDCSRREFIQNVKETSKSCTLKLNFTYIFLNWKSMLIPLTKSTKFWKIKCDYYQQNIHVVISEKYVSNHKWIHISKI